MASSWRPGGSANRPSSHVLVPFRSQPQDSVTGEREHYNVDLAGTARDGPSRANASNQDPRGTMVGAHRPNPDEVPRKDRFHQMQLRSAVRVPVTSVPTTLAPITLAPITSVPATLASGGNEPDKSRAAAFARQHPKCPFSVPESLTRAEFSSLAVNCVCKGDGCDETKASKRKAGDRARAVKFAQMHAMYPAIVPDRLTRRRSSALADRCVCRGEGCSESAVNRCKQRATAWQSQWGIYDVPGEFALSVKQKATLDKDIKCLKALYPNLPMRVEVVPGLYQRSADYYELIATGQLQPPMQTNKTMAACTTASDPVASLRPQGDEQYQATTGPTVHPSRVGLVAECDTTDKSHLGNSDSGQKAIVSNVRTRQQTLALSTGATQRTSPRPEPRQIGVSSAGEHPGLPITVEKLIEQESSKVKNNLPTSQSVQVSPRIQSNPINTFQARLPQRPVASQYFESPKQYSSDPQSTSLTKAMPDRSVVSKNSVAIGNATSAVVASDALTCSSSNQKRTREEAFQTSADDEVVTAKRSAYTMRDSSKPSSANNPERSRLAVGETVGQPSCGSRFDSCGPGEHFPVSQRTMKPSSRSRATAASSTSAVPIEIGGLESSTFDVMPNLSYLDDQLYSSEKLAAFAAEYPLLSRLNKKMTRIDVQLKRLSEVKDLLTEEKEELMKDWDNTVSRIGSKADVTAKAMEQQRTETFHQRLSSIQTPRLETRMVSNGAGRLTPPTEEDMQTCHSEDAEEEETWPILNYN